MTTFTTQDRQDAQRDALTKDKVTQLANEYLCYIEYDYESTGIYEFARAIERAHGIGE